MKLLSLLGKTCFNEIFKTLVYVKSCVWVRTNANKRQFSFSCDPGLAGQLMHKKHEFNLGNNVIQAGFKTCCCLLCRWVLYIRKLYSECELGCNEGQGISVKYKHAILSISNHGRNKTRPEFLCMCVTQESTVFCFCKEREISTAFYQEHEPRRWLFHESDLDCKVSDLATNYLEQSLNT